MNAEENKRNKVLLKGTIIYAIGNFGTKILSFLIVPLYTFYISPADLGAYDILVSTVSLLSPMITLRISEATYRWMIQGLDNDINCLSATYNLLFRNCAITFLLIAVTNYFIPIWNWQYFASILVLDRILECLQKVLRGVKNQKLYAFSGVFYTALFVFLNLYLICYIKMGVVALLQSTVISQLATILLIVICEKRLRTYKPLKNYKSLRKKMIKYSAPLVPSALSWWVMGASDRYIIRFFLGSTANGIYAVACKFPSILTTIFVMFNNAWTDLALAELRAGNSTKEYTKKIFREMYMIAFGLTLVLIPATKVITQFILGNAYVTASVYIGFLYLGSVFQGFSAFCSIGYLQDDKTNGAAISSLYGALVNVAIDLLLIKYIGLFAAAISTFVGFFVMWIVRVRHVREKFPVEINKREFYFYLIVLLLLATFSIWSTIWIDIVLTVIASICFILTNRKYLKHILLRYIHKNGANNYDKKSN